MRALTSDVTVAAVASINVRPLIIWDGDDTLWFVEPLYDAARARVRQYVSGLGFDGERWEQLQREIDVRNVALMGLSQERFPTSCVQAYDELASATFGGPNERHRSEIRRMASAVFRRAAPLAEGVHPALRAAGRLARMVLLTKGDETVQAQRITSSGLAEYFDRTFVVNDKSPNVFQDVLDQMKVEARDAWSVGNSLPSDINPALQIGMSAVWIDAHVWEHERRETEAVEGRLFVATTLKDAVRTIREHSALLA